MKVLLYIVLLYKIVVSVPPSTSCADGTWEVDCTPTDNSADVHFSVEGDCGTELDCTTIDRRCSTLLGDAYSASCVSAESIGINVAAYPPLNSAGKTQMCTFFDGQSSRFSTQFTNVGYTGRSCGGGLCTFLPNGGSSCYCLTKNGEFFEGKLDLSAYNTPQITVKQ